MNDLDQERACELKRVRQQLFALADAARAFRELVLAKLLCTGKQAVSVQLLQADTDLRDVLTIVARMRRFG